MKPDDIAEVLLNGGEVNVNEHMALETGDELINWADKMPGVTEFDGTLQPDYIYVDTVLYYPKGKGDYTEVQAFVNTFAPGADEFELTDIGSDEPWRAWWD